MATGDIIVFNEARAYQLDGGWEPADVMFCAVLDNTTAPLVGDTTPALADYTQVGVGGIYVAGGVTIGTWGDFVDQTAGTVTFDSVTNPTWAQDAGNDVDAYWGLVYNNTQATDPAWCFVELGGPVDMSAGALTITWNASGLSTIS